MSNTRRQLEWLDNDVAILETVFANREGDTLVVPPQYMPDGVAFSISLKGAKKMDNELRLKIVQLVRDQWHAREDSKKAPKVERTAASKTGGRGGSDAERAGGDSVRTEPPVQEREASLETILESQVTALGGRVTRLRSTLEELNAERNRVREQLDAAEYDLDYAKTMLEGYRCTQGSQTGSQTGSSTSEAEKGQRTQASGSKSDSQSSRSKTNRRSAKR